MTQFNPGTTLTAVCTFTLAGGPGKFQNAAVWVSTNAKDVITSVDDNTAGTSTATIDGSANATGDTSVFTCTADGDLGKGVVLVAATSDTVEWTDTVDIEADGATISMSSPALATPKQLAAHVAAGGKKPAGFANPGTNPAAILKGA